MTSTDVSSAVAHHVHNGARVETQTPEMAIVVTGNPTSTLESVLHIVLCVLTIGLWIPIWLVRELVSNARARRIVITAHGESPYRWLFGKWRPTRS